MTMIDAISIFNKSISISPNLDDTIANIWINVWLVFEIWVGGVIGVDVYVPSRERWNEKNKSQKAFIFNYRE